MTTDEKLTPVCDDEGDGDDLVGEPVEPDHDLDPLTFAVMTEAEEDDDA